jgi:hypothetical protein
MTGELDGDPFELATRWAQTLHAHQFGDGARDGRRDGSRALDDFRRRSADQHGDIAAAAPSPLRPSACDCRFGRSRAQKRSGPRQLATPTRDRIAGVGMRSRSSRAVSET